MYPQAMTLFPTKAPNGRGRLLRAQASNPGSACRERRGPRGSRRSSSPEPRYDLEGVLLDSLNDSHGDRPPGPETNSGGSARRQPRFNSSDRKVLVIGAGSRRRRFRSYDLKRIKHRLARWCYRAIAWLERYRFEAAARDETASTESARWGAWAVADVLNDALCRLQREFLHAERHKDDNHDPAEDGQQTIRAAAVFSDIKRYFHVSCFFEDWSRLARKMRVGYSVRAGQHRCYIHLQFPAHNDVHVGPQILR
jgi:hypothetical protein